jgi:spermidine synthase
MIRRTPFLAGVFGVSAAVLMLQTAETRLLSVIAWYYLAFFAISVAILGLTIGATWVYLRRERFSDPTRLVPTLSRFALLSAVAVPISLLCQLSLITSFAPTLAVIAAWSLLLAAMTLPYVFAGVVLSLALTRSPFPLSLVYGTDLVGAALGCLGVVGLLSVVDGPTTMLLIGLVGAVGAVAFAASAPGTAMAGVWRLGGGAWWRRPGPVAVALAGLVGLNLALPIGIKPIVVKDMRELELTTRYEKWNPYSRIVAYKPYTGAPFLWGPSPKLPAGTQASWIQMNIDGMAGTAMVGYDGTPQSVNYLRYDITNLAYGLPGIRSAAVVGVGGGRDLVSAHLFGVPQITGIELNPIFVNLDTKNPYYRNFGHIDSIPGLHLHVDDARNWFAATSQRFDSIEMSMIDTWAATGAGAFSLSENGLYTLEGWRTFLHALTPHGVFTVSRWYDPNNLLETGRMISLATAAVLATGAPEASSHLFVATASNIATLVLSKSPFTAAQVARLRGRAQRLGFGVLLAPGQPPADPVLRAIVQSHTLDQVNAAASRTYLDLSVPTDNRPFFFNQLKFNHIRAGINNAGSGVLKGNLEASAVLLLILLISIVAVLVTVVLPLRRTVRQRSANLAIGGTAYFALIGAGFILAEISLIEYLSVYLGNPIYSLAVCLFSLILATGLGSLASGVLRIDTRARFFIWGLLTAGCLFALDHWILSVVHSTQPDSLGTRILISVALLMPLGFLFGFAFPTGLRVTSEIDPEPAPWFWGINGASGVTGSVLAVIISIAFGINVAVAVAGVCYLALIAAGQYLLTLRARTAMPEGAAPSPAAASTPELVKSA